MLNDFKGNMRFEPLISSKLFIPQLRNQIIPRPRLHKMLEDGMKRRLTLISACAGSGKTTLLSQWVQKCQVPVSWVTLDDHLSELGRLLYYLMHALHKIDQENIKPEIHYFQPMQPIPDEWLLTNLINETYKIQGDFVLILDDYHTVQGAKIDDVLTYFIDNLPPHVHLFIASRVDPQLSLSRRRARGDLLEIRTEHLRFTPDEARWFLEQAAGIRISEESSTALVERSDGWIAAIQLAALSIFEDRDPMRFVRSFRGTNRYIADYLTEEVFEKQPESIRDFLLRISILKRFCGSLCLAVTGDPESQLKLEHLERTNTLVFPLDRKRVWYRFQRLFSELLRHQLKQKYPQEMEELYSRARDWHLDHGFEEDAVYYAQVVEEIYSNQSDLTHTMNLVINPRRHLKSEGSPPDGTGNSNRLGHGSGQQETQETEALTDRETEVLSLLAEGYTGERIASQLFISVGTVRTHVRNIYRKLDVHNRVEALERARALELLTS